MAGRPDAVQPTGVTQRVDGPEVSARAGSVQVAASGNVHLRKRDCERLGAASKEHSIGVREKLAAAHDRDADELSHYGSDEERVERDRRGGKQGPARSTVLADEDNAEGEASRDADNRWQPDIHEHEPARRPVDTEEEAEEGNDSSEGQAQEGDGCGQDRG